jgi:hypothetical protein
LPSSRFALPPESGGDFREGGNASAGSESIGADDAPNEGDLTRVVPGEELIPSILPGPIPEPRERFDIPPSRPGEGREHLPNHTGGDAPNHDVLIDQIEELLPAKDNGPLITSTPTADQIYRLPWVLFAINRAKGIYGSAPSSKLMEVLRDVEEKTGIKIQFKQFRLLKAELQQKSFWETLPKSEVDRRRSRFGRARPKVISEWEAHTGLTWPTYVEEYEEDGVKKTRVVQYQAHHLIPILVDGPLTEWWNIHPARYPDQHQGGIHGKGSPLNELTK